MLLQYMCFLSSAFSVYSGHRCCFHSLVHAQKKGTKAVAGALSFQKVNLDGTHQLYNVNKSNKFILLLLFI